MTSKLPPTPTTLCTPAKMSGSMASQRRAVVGLDRPISHGWVLFLNLCVFRQLHDGLFLQMVWIRSRMNQGDPFHLGTCLLTTASTMEYRLMLPSL